MIRHGTLQNLLAAFIAAFLGALSIHYVHSVFVYDAEYDGWVLGDWLIHYGGGFTRRGAWGQGLLTMADATGLPLWMLGFASQMLLYGAFLAAFLILIWNRDKPLWFVALVFSPLTFLFTSNDTYAAGRKEVLLFAALAWYAIALRDVRIARSRLFAVAAGAGTAAATLTHEMFFFYLPYFGAAARLACVRYGTRMTSAGGIAAGATLAFLSVLWFGSAIPGAAICADLIARGASPSVCTGIIANTEALQDTFGSTLSVGGVAFHGTAMLAALLPTLVAVRYEAFAPVSAGSFIRFLVVAVAWSAPLFAVAADWGRYIRIHMVGLMILASILLKPRDQTRDQAPVQVGILAATAGAVALFSLTWGVSHCCSNRPIAGGAVRYLLLRLGYEL